jgi:hypothetical protein
VRGISPHRGLWGLRREYQKTGVLLEALFRIFDSSDIFVTYKRLFLPCIIILLVQVVRKKSIFIPLKLKIADLKILQPNKGLKNIKFLYLVLTAISYLIPLNAQIKSLGTPEIVNYVKKSNPQITETWGITQNNLGVMYFANSYGYLIFDGKKWSQFSVSNKSVVRSIFTDISGRTYVGAYDEFGYLEPSNNGQLFYHSLLSKIKPGYRDFSEIWRIYQIGDRIFFQSSTIIFVLQNDDVTYFTSQYRYEFSFCVNNTFYALDQSTGLLEYQNEVLVPVPMAKDFIKLKIWQILPMENKKLLIVTENDGLFIYDRLTLKPWQIEVNDILKKNQVYCAVKAFYKYYIFGTIQNGIIIINEEGKLVQHINKEKGLQSNYITSLYIDKSNNLWVGNDYGIDLIPISSPLTWFDNRSGIQGVAYCILPHSNLIYIGTNRGLYFNYIEPGYNDGGFKIIEGTKGKTWSLYPFSDKIVCGHNLGSLIIEDNQAKSISKVFGSWIFWQDKELPGYLFEGNYNGILVYTIQNNTLQFRNKIDGIKESSRIVEKDEEGYYWIAHPNKGIDQVKFNDKLTAVTEFNFYSIEKGCPKNVYEYKIGNDLIFTSPEGTFKLNKYNNKFEPDTKYSAIFKSQGQVTGIKEDAVGNVWYVQNSKMYFLKKTSQGFQHINYPELNKLQDLLIPGYERIYTVDSTSVFFSTANGVAHFNPSLSKRKPAPYNALINEVKCPLKDSTLFSGISNNLKEKLELPSSMNAIYFSFSAAYFEVPEKICFKYRLKGFENNWSEWTDKNFKDYTNLREGRYTFEVVAKNYMGQESQHAYYNFRISPPWFRTIAAYIVYLLIILSLIFIVFRFIKIKFQRQQERIVNEKTIEINKKQKEYKEELLQSEMEKKNLELASIALQIAAKNEVLIKVVTSLQNIEPQVAADAKILIGELIGTTQNNIDLDTDWKKFLDYFNEVHDNFLEKLKNRYKDLTSIDLRLCAYLRMQLTTKEIAALMNISVRGVEKARYRLRKKINIDPNLDLSEFIITIS